MTTRNRGGGLQNMVYRQIVGVVLKEAQAMPELEELQDLLTAMAESEPEPGTAEQSELGTIAWYLNGR